MSAAAVWAANRKKPQAWLQALRKGLWRAGCETSWRAGGIATALERISFQRYHALIAPLLSTGQNKQESPRLRAFLFSNDASAALSVTGQLRRMLGSVSAA